MYGAIIGDVVGSQYEFNNIKTKDFELFTDRCSYTDDSLMTIAVANALMMSRQSLEKFKQNVISEMQEVGRKYPFPQGGYGGRFAGWLQEKNPVPYGSYGNGSAMRVSPCGIFAETLEDAIRNAISIGGDSDTIGAITGTIAWSFYMRSFLNKDYVDWEPEAAELVEKVRAYLPDEMKGMIAKFEKEVK